MRGPDVLWTVVPPLSMPLLFRETFAPSISRGDFSLFFPGLGRWLVLIIDAIWMPMPSVGEAIDGDYQNLIDVGSNPAVNIKQGQQQDRLTTCRCLWWRRHHGYWWDQRIFPGQWKNRGSRRYVSQLSAAQGTDNKRMKTWKFSDNLDLITATLEAWYWIGDSMAICWRVSKLFPICPIWFVFKVAFIFPLAFGKEGVRRKAEEGGSELWAGAQPLSHFPFQPRPALCQPSFQAPFPYQLPALAIQLSQECCLCVAT